ncbi:MAG: MBL fold metallo-hydrolase [Deltaproteobacteria bacterium]|nr:MBL fold metallo-hydrolase [Deltaproteobacteria bacterium]
MVNISEDLYMITLPMPFRLKHVHVFALVHDNGVALFDTGVNTPEAFTKLEGALRSIGKDIHDIDRIFITHFHTDHCGIAGRIKDLSGAAIFMSETDARRIYDDQRGSLDINLVRGFYRQHGLSERFIDGLLRLLDFFKKATIPFRVDEYFEGHGTYHFGRKKFEIIPAPGHTSGQVCFYLPDERILLSGDHVLPHITPNLSPDPYNPDFRPLRCFLDSLQKVVMLPVVTAYPSHGEPILNLRARVEEIREHHRERTGLILSSVKWGQKTTFHVSLDIFGSELTEFDQFLAVNETYAHLVELEKEGLIRKKWEGEYLVYSAV